MIRPRMKALICVSFLFTTAPLVCAYDVGSQLIVIEDTPASFYDQFERNLQKGETITVAKHDYGARRVYFLSINSEGKQIALNVSESSVETKNAHAARLEMEARAQQEKEARALQEKLDKEMLKDFPKWRAKMIDEWTSIRKNPDNGVNVRWMFKTTYYKEQYHSYSGIPVGYSLELCGYIDASQRHKAIVTAEWVAPSPEAIVKDSKSFDDFRNQKSKPRHWPDTAPKRDDWVIVEGRIAKIGDDGAVHIVPTRIINYGYRGEEADPK